MRTLILAASLFLVPEISRADDLVNCDNPSDPSPTPIRLHYMLTEKGDTLPTVNLRPVTIEADRSFKTKKGKREWLRLKYNVNAVYALSQAAGNKMKQINAQLIGKSKSEQKELLKRTEEELKAEYKDKIKGLSMEQGRILIKLIDRETGNSSYDLVKDLRGSFQAFCWQSIARVFGANLKESYDPNVNKEDRLIEDIVVSIQDGSFTN
jgi:hypothetical protein